LLIYKLMEHLRAKRDGGRGAKEGALAYPEDTSYLAYEYASGYV